ncbi:MAG TPA: alpha/beta hydrolase [Chitinophagaceae bacterium]|nr:alpha/beta hydrolase [Chitinophagaceae bacterium]HUM65218.1 alpha/beta hydrolase [Chitinophagaceae bacterium]
MNKELSYQDRNIFYRVFGEGKTVLLLHGFGETGEVWQQQVEFLKNDFKLIVPDLPGSGRSAIIDDMSMEGLADAIKKIADEEGIDSGNNEVLTMIGHSMGGYITMAFAEKYPQYLDAFGLFHSSAYADSDEKRATRKKGIEFVREHGAFEFFKTSTPKLFSPVTIQDNPSIVKALLETLEDFSAEAVIMYYEAMMQRPDRTEILKKTDLPVLFVIGEHDNAVPPSDSLQQAHLPHTSFIHLLKNSGHMGMLEEAERSGLILKEFMTET